jgi:hypothetical protein
MKVVLQLVNQAGVVSLPRTDFVDTTWREYTTAPLRTFTGGNVSVAIQVVAYPAPNCTQIKLDNAQLTVLPTTQVQYTTPSDSDCWQYATTVKETWTNTFTIAPEVAAWQLPAGSHMLVRRWQLDAADYMDLLYDVTSQTFELSIMRDGAEVAAVTSSVITWQALSRLKFSVSVSQTGVWLSVSDGDPPDTVEAPVDPATSDLAPLLNGTLTVKAFNPGGGTMLFPQYLFTSLDTWQ